MHRATVFVLLCHIFILWPNSQALFKFTNIKCKCFDPQFCEFRQCELKVLGRGIIAMSLYTKVHQLPLHNISVNLGMFRKFNGYRPFLYNTTVDFCDYSKHPKRYPFFQWFHSLIRKASNINHTCPYEHDFIVSKLVLNDEMLSLMPLPTGSYMFQLKAATDSIWRANVEAYVEIIEVGA